MTDSLTPALTRASARLARPGTPAVSVLIHVLVFALWVTLFLLAFGRGGVLAWSVGLAYLGYDAALQVFTGWQIRRIGRPRDDGSAPSAEAGTDRLTLAVIVAARNEATALPDDPGGAARPDRPAR